MATKFFHVRDRGSQLNSDAASQVLLVRDNWDDYGYTTQYHLTFITEQYERIHFGNVKIGQFGMASTQRRADIPDDFDHLGSEFFSLGQDESYYEHLNELEETLRDRILFGLRDIARDAELYEHAVNEKVTGVSLLRFVTKATVCGQFRRLSMGGARLSLYEFSYRLPSSVASTSLEISFRVQPDSQPPTNIHVLIGRNGVGKTHLLNYMTRALVDRKAKSDEVGEFTSTDAAQTEPLFANVVSVTFSAFDSFEPLPNPQNKATVSVEYSYIGLKRVRTSDKSPALPKTPRQLSTEFGKSVKACREGARLGRWRHALEMLEADPIFRDADVAELAKIDFDDEAFNDQASALFAKLSSGHKVVLLTVTRLVETVAERTLVLLDEPEAHLHPPLLSAFIRSLSDLLINRNGVAIIATHSPVVLQEVPRRCAWKIRRHGREIVAERPEMETFGENVGVLTREVFGLEVTDSGFHKLLSDKVAEFQRFEAIVEEFDGALGGEARAIVRALIAARDSGAV